jgi:hypothetical protein
MTNQTLCEGTPETVSCIVDRKEEERRAGGEFWWGMRTPLGANLREVVQESGGRITAAFSENQEGQIEEGGLLWTKYEEIEDGENWKIDVPEHVLVVGPKMKNKHPPHTYGLVCASSAQLMLRPQVINMGEFETHPLGKNVDSRQSAVILRRKPNPNPTDRATVYRTGFTATLIKQVKLIAPKPLTTEQAHWFGNWKQGNWSWMDLVRKLRGAQ